MDKSGTTILVVEDESSLREMLEVALKRTGHKARFSATLKSGLSELEKGGIDIVLTDVKLPDGSGLDILARAKTVPERPPVLIMTAFGSTDMAVEAMKLGAFHYLTKPFKLEELNLLIGRALSDAALHKENQTLKKEAKKQFSVESMVGTSKAMKDLQSLIDRVGQTKSNVLVTGESGTGKELIARALHYSGTLRSKPFVTVNCGAIPETLMESEMFGHKRGSFTGAVAEKEGLFHVSDGGSIFLDEVGELPPGIQVKLLRVLQDRSFRPVGGTESTKVDVRVISATNRNLEEMVAKGEFREDLYYRLNVINIQTPALRERKEDVPQLVEHFLTKFSLGMGKNITRVAPAAMDILKEYEFPGNIRELQNILERAVALEGHAEITVESLPPHLKKRKAPGVSIPSLATTGIVTAASSVPQAEDPFQAGPVDLEARVGEIERFYLLKSMDRAKGVKKEAARLLGISFRSFRYRLAKYGMDTGDDGEESKE